MLTCSGGERTPIPLDNDTEERAQLLQEVAMK